MLDRRTDLQDPRSLQTDASLTNQALAERGRTSRPRPACAGCSALVDAGVIERRVAHRFRRSALGHGLTAIVEVTLDRQSARGAGRVRGARRRRGPRCASATASRPGPDFVLIVQVADMAAYHALVQRLFTQDANVRNVKASSASAAPSSRPRIALPAQRAVSA